MSEHPINSKSFMTSRGQLNTNPRGGVSLKLMELYNSSVLYSIFLGLRSDLPYVRWFSTIIRNTFFYWKWQETTRCYLLLFVNRPLTLNLRGGVLSKWTKLFISSVKLALFQDRRSKLASVWCSVSVITNKVFMENDRTPDTLFSLLGSQKGQLNISPRSVVSLKWTKLYNSSVSVSVFLGLRSDDILCTMVWNNH